MRYRPSFQAALVGLGGHFNPAIFSPAWLVANGIAPEIDPEKPPVGAAIFDEGAEVKFGDVTIQAQPNSVAVSSTGEPFLKVADICLSLFRDKLRHTPISSVNIVYVLHFSLDSMEQRTKLGRALAPVGPWGEWGRLVEGGEEGRIGGLRSLLMEEVCPAGRAAGQRRVRIEPSVKAEHADIDRGVYMRVEDAFDVGKETEGAGDAMDILASEFDRSIAMSKSIVSDLMSYSVQFR